MLQKRYLKFLTIFGLISLFSANLAIAADISLPPYVTDLTDLSRQYLGKIFGGRIGSIYLGGGSNPILGRMFFYFNSIVIAFGLIIVTYTGFVSVINTAQEGEVLGKKWSSVWIPIRSALGLALLLPISNGYCLIQMAIIWIILQGIGAANLVYTTLVQDLTTKSGSSLIGDPRIDPVAINEMGANLKNILPTLLSAAVCQEALDNRAPNSNDESTKLYGGNTSFYIDRKETTSSKVIYKVGVPNAPAPWDEICGRFGVGEFQGDTEAKNFFMGELVTLYNTIRIGVARTIADGVPYDPEYFDKDKPNKDLAWKRVSERISSANETVSGNNLIQFAFENLLGNYILNFSNKLANANRRSIQANKNSCRAAGLGDNCSQGQLRESFKQKGWITTPLLLAAVSNNAEITKNWNCGEDKCPVNNIFTGTVNRDSSSKGPNQIPAGDKERVLFYVDAINAATSSELLPPSLTDKGGTSSNISFSSPNINESLGEGMEEMTAILSVLLGDAVSIFAQDIYGMGETAYTGVQQALGGDRAGAQSSFQSAYSQFTNVAQGPDLTRNPLYTDNPLALLVKVGKRLMTAAEIAFFAGLAIAIAIMAPSALGALGNNFSGFLLLFTVASIFTLLAAMVMMFWAFGAILGIYTPMIPIMFFAGSAIAWMFLVIEAVVAAPILALGFISPGGDYLGKTEQGFVIIANVFLRPVLMIFGFILGLRLLSAAMFLINSLLLPVFFNETFIASDIMGFSIIIIVAIYTMFVLSVVNKTFSLIYVLPDNIMRWIGGQAEQGFGIENLVSETKQKTEGAAENVGGSMRGLTEGSMNKSKEIANARRK